MIDITVVIPARDAAATIGTTLQTIIDAERKPDEIIVADGLSQDETAAIARRCGARVVVNPKGHAAGGRQVGTEAAHAEVIAFTDADCLPAQDWLRRVAGHFDSESQLVGVGGKILLTEPRNRIQAFSANVFENIMQFPNDSLKVTSKGMRGSFAGANCAYRREAILSVGGFRDEFSNYAEEIDLFWRLLDQKAELLFDPAITVVHPGYTDSYRGLVKTNFRYGISSTKLARHHIRRPRVDWTLYRTLLTSLLHFTLKNDEDEWAGLRVIQLSSFIVGKWYSSIREGIINL